MIQSSEKSKNGKITLLCDRCGRQAVIYKTSYYHWKRRNKANDGDYFCSKCRINDSNKELVANKKPKHHKVTCPSCKISRVICNRSRSNDRLCIKCSHNKFKKIKIKKTKEEISMACSEAMTSLWKNQEYRDKQLSYRNDIWRRKISKSIRKKWVDGDYENSTLHRNTWLQRATRAALIMLELEFEEEFVIPGNFPYSFDFKIGNVLLELDGDYWHNLPNCKANDIRKEKFVKNHSDYTLLRISENKLKCFNSLLDILKSNFNVRFEPFRLDFNQLKIARVSLDFVRDFVNALHYLAKPRYGGFAYEITYSNIRAGVIVLQRPVRQESATSLDVKYLECYEITRIVVNPKFHKTNLISWALSRVIKDQRKNFDTKVIISFSDLTVGHTGAAYKASNFKLHKIVPASYWYESKDGYLMHKKTLWDHAKKMGYTEDKFAKLNGYRKIYGREKLKFVYWLD